MINGETIGVGIITYKRNNLLLKLIKTIPKSIVDFIILVDDGGDLRNMSNDFIDGKIIINETNLGVGKSKNIALRRLLEHECDHIFLIEDDMFIKDSKIFEKYITTSKVTGLQHLMFGYHGPANKGGISKGEPKPRLIINYNKDIAIALNQHSVGAFCYYSKKCLEDVGLIDEKFINAFDHVSHSYDLAMKGYTTPYWWWADVWNSNDFIEEQVCSEESSSIKTPERIQEWQFNIQNAMRYFKEKYGYAPFGNGGIPDISEQEVLQFLKSKKA